jgi:carbon monoxide dehydrogenase subunit G
MEIKGEQLIPASVPQVWNALNDPDVLKACIGGCESLERESGDSFTALVSVRVGPVSARFKGHLKMTNVQAPTSYTINFTGQGGVAGFGKGSADVRLAGEGPHTRLHYQATAQVGGKLAQIGSRLIEAAAAKISDDFFRAFKAKLTELHPLTVSHLGEEAPTDEDALVFKRSGLFASAWFWLLAACTALMLAYFSVR